MAGENPNTSPTASGLNEEQVTDIVMKVVNGAISSRDKMADKKREQDKLEFKKLLEESLTGFKASITPVTETPEGTPIKGKKDVEIETLRKQLEEVSRQAKATDAERAKERAVNRATTLRQRVIDALAVHGIEGLKAKTALALFKDENRVVMAEDNDDVTFKNDDGTEVDLNVGLQGWIKTEPARLFVPPTGAKGAGSKPGQNGLPAGTTREDAVKAFWETVGASVRSG